MYKKIIAALDGSPLSNLCMDASLDIARKMEDALLIGCHVYASNLHRTRFEEMEPGLPEQYQEEQRLVHLRDTHEDLITEGMQLISDAYLAPLAEKAMAQNLAFSGLTPEGHHYVKLLQAIREHQVDLTIVGASGHGYVPEESLGSLTERLLFYADRGDILIIRQKWQFKNKPILVGIDGSLNSYQALKCAVELGKLFEAPVEAVAIYDPYFHSTVFKTIADALPADAAEKFNFTAQERLHDEIIDRGLETLYRDGLRRAVIIAKEMGAEIQTKVLAGKVYSQLHHYAVLQNASMIVVGRYGLHQEEESKIGSNALKLARLAQYNLMIVQPPANDMPLPELGQKEQGRRLPWDPEAERVLKRIPSFVRKMAARSIESRAIEQGQDHVTLELVMQVSSKMGMDRKG